MKNRRRIIIFIGLFLLGLIFGLGQPVSAAPERKAIVSKVKGNVEVKKAQNAWQKAKVGSILHEMDELRTQKGGYAEILLDDGGSTGNLEVKENTHLRLSAMNWLNQGDEKKTMIDVAAGKVKVYANQLKGDSKFEVNTPTAVLGIRGTRFEVHVVEEKKQGKE